MPYIFVGVFSCSFNLDRSRMFGELFWDKWYFMVYVCQDVYLADEFYAPFLVKPTMMLLRPSILLWMKEKSDWRICWSKKVKVDQIGIFPILRYSTNNRISCGSIVNMQACQRWLSGVKGVKSWTRLVESNSVWQCEAVLYYCLLIVYVQSTSLFYRWFTFIPLSLWHRWIEPEWTLPVRCTGGLRMQRSTGCRAFSIGSPLFHLPTKHVAQPQVSAGQLKRIQRIHNFLL